MVGAQACAERPPTPESLAALRELLDDPHEETIWYNTSPWSNKMYPVRREAGGTLNQLDPTSHITYERVLALAGLYQPPAWWWFGAPILAAVLFIPARRRLRQRLKLGSSD